jgi:hypothetical protein
MTAASFQVALTGLKDGHSANDVAHHLALLFKQPPEKMLAILDGKRRILKKGLSEADARKYEAALHGAGCTCAISPVPAPGPAAGARGTRDIASAAAAALASASERHRDRQARLAQSALEAGQKLFVDALILHGVYLLVLKHLALLPSLIGWLVMVAVMIASLIRTCRGLGCPARKRDLLAALMFVPLAGLITLALLSHKASKKSSSQQANLKYNV